MFRIECFCEDKKLAGVLHALAGQVIGMPGVTPVVNVEVKAGKLKQVTNGKLIDLFAEHLRTDKPEIINADYMRQFLRAMGRSNKSYSHLLKKAQDTKLIRKTGKGTASRYTVLPAKG
jgi:hypothetical protein